MIPSEHEEQVEFIQWCDRNNVTVFAIPNGSHKSKAAANKFKAEGLRSGVPDLMIPIAKNGYNGLFIEMKRIKNSATSENQKEWILLLRDLGYKAEVAKGADMATEIAEEYLKHKI